VIEVYHSKITLFRVIHTCIKENREIFK
jgi:hypothetical protein